MPNSNKNMLADKPQMFVALRRVFMQFVKAIDNLHK